MVPVFAGWLSEVQVSWHCVPGLFLSFFFLPLSLFSACLHALTCLGVWFWVVAVDKLAPCMRPSLSSEIQSHLTRATLPYAKAA